MFGNKNSDDENKSIEVKTPAQDVPVDLLSDDPVTPVGTADVEAGVAAMDQKPEADAEASNAGNTEVVVEEGGAVEVVESQPKMNPVKKLGAKLQESARKLTASSRQIHETHIRPKLQQAGASVRLITETTKQKTREITAATAQKTRDLGLTTQLAVAAATAKTSHTLSQIGSNPLEHDVEIGDAEGGRRHKVKGEATDGFVTHLHQYGVQGFCVIAFVSGVVSLVLVVAHLVDFSSLFLMALAPLAFWQKTQLKSLGGMRGQQNELREHVNKLTSENGKLKTSIDQMEEQVAELQHVEKDLAAVADKAGGQVDRLVSIVHENGQIQKEIKAILEDDILQQIVTAVINADRDADYKLNKMEVRQLEYRLKNIPGVVFYHDRFKSFLASDEGDLTLADVTNIARNLGDESVPVEKQIFEFEPKQIIEEKRKADAAGGSAIASPSRS